MEFMYKSLNYEFSIKVEAVLLIALLKLSNQETLERLTGMLFAIPQDIYRFFILGGLF